MIAIIGSNGSMGKRYQAIMNFLGKPHLCFDKEDSIDTIRKVAAEAEGFIIATPTPTHAEFLRQLLPTRRKILCEKPVTKDLGELIDLDGFCSRHGFDFQMTMQYQELMKLDSLGPSYYDYFRTGNDGLVWDCLQIIGLSDEIPVLENKSPIWSCMINGHRLNLGDMDLAYVECVRKWMGGRLLQTRKTVIDMHRKTDEFARGYYARPD